MTRAGELEWGEASRAWFETNFALGSPGQEHADRQLQLALLGPIDPTAPFQDRFDRIASSLAAMTVGDVVGVLGAPMGGCLEPCRDGLWVATYFTGIFNLAIYYRSGAGNDYFNCRINTPGFDGPVAEYLIWRHLASSPEKRHLASRR
jgi:hypothetical protein